MFHPADSGFVILQGTTYWTDLFVRHFLFQAEHTIDGDDLLFFVRKKHVKTSSRYLPKFETEVDVFRKDSKKLPIGDPDIDWEETVYLNLVVHQFDYTLTLAICTRTSPKELQVSRFFQKFSQPFSLFFPPTSFAFSSIVNKNRFRYYAGTRKKCTRAPAGDEWTRRVISRR